MTLALALPSAVAKQPPRAVHPGLPALTSGLRCDSTSAKPRPAYAIRVRHSEVGGGEGLGASHGVRFAAPVPSEQHSVFWWLSFELGSPYHRVWA